MEQIKQLKYSSVYFDEDNGIFETVWENGNAYINEDEIRETILAYTNLVKDILPEYYLGNDLSREFIYTVSIQQWVALTLSEACISANIKKFALLLPDDIIAQISTEQIVDEAGLLPFELQYFSDRNAALEWFKSDE